MLKFMFIESVMLSNYLILSHSSQVLLVVKNPPANAGVTRDVGLISGFRKILWRRAWQLTPVFLPRKLPEQRILVVYSPQGHKGLDMTGHTHTHT